MGTFALLTILLSWINSRWRSPGRVTHGIPVVVFADGQPITEAMRRERLGLDELAAAARGQGIERFDDIRIAVMETNGQLSFFTRAGGESGAPEQPSVG